jgi:hypothetical protein
MFELFILFIAFVIPAALLFAALFAESLGWAVVVSLVVVVAWWFFGIVNFSLLWSMPWWGWIVGVVGYVGIGVIWATIKWYIKVRDSLADFRKIETEARADFDKKVATGASLTFKEYVKGRYSIPPEAKNNKDDIVLWMMWWWMSMIVTFIGDFIVRLFNNLYEWVRTMFDRITAHVFKDTGL